MSQIDPLQLAEKIARLIETERPREELSLISETLERINERLDKLESASSARSALSKPLAKHSSLDKFSIAEAIADQIFAGADKEKACTFEPTPRPCDHCAMCNSRGF